MKVVAVELIILYFFVICIGGEEEGGKCRLVADVGGFAHINVSLCYLHCLSNALNKLYTDGEQRLFVNEEVYANASRILDDMEGKTGESTTYLSVFSSSMGEQNDKLEKLISYGNEMGDLVAKVGGLFAEVNESVREVRNELPNTLIKANKYYTAIAVITKTVWNDVKAVGLDSDMAKCSRQEFSAVENFEASCGDQTCPLENSVTESSLQKYKDGCLTITILNGSVSECLNRLRDNLYRSGAVQSSRKILEWRGEDRHGAFYFQLTLEIQQIFSTLITPFAAGKPPFALLDMMANITSLNSHFNWVHGNFTSLLLDIGVAGNVSNTNSTI
ncbi:expression site-associated gene (ESAG) protein, putative [Trypanosoma brucei brucei TREU927]|uniref:Expression site-associated gene (ESAG) protein, putative n=1 Tax=Trypanosoma brucei brucei (strain 927/4 GUTat10.1) TaxID=185431 RepID=Q57TR1_TRYB2|nr:expression site-associated gene (ESAG) protein, putative [Trypanosoma brucei brucei TREU927]AAX81079.1 expression site-associated gene (ESAG) protein, putative [Trypanosoma brucei]AAZ10092.1 expression site-associated gene (ESAG) protein, putative [Trypanosoma brucei brucei TREU927]